MMPRSPKSGGAVFSPRTLADNPKKFGRTSTPLIAADLVTPQQQAAELQHALSNTVREHLLDKNTTLSKFCEDDMPEGINQERCERILRGETMMTFTDLMFWASQISDFSGKVESTMRRLTATTSADGDQGASEDPRASEATTVRGALPPGA